MRKGEQKMGKREKRVKQDNTEEISQNNVQSILHVGVIYIHSCLATFYLVTNPLINQWVKKKKKKKIWKKWEMVGKINLINWVFLTCSKNIRNLTCLLKKKKKGGEGVKKMFYPEFYIGFFEVFDSTY